MAGMKRFVTYIYEYENEKKKNNIGFAKIEIRGEECRIEIHLRGIYIRKAVCAVYLFREDAGLMEGILIGEMRLANGMGDFYGGVKAECIGESMLGISDMEGIFLLTEDDRIFMSRWKEGKPLVVRKEKFHVWEVRSKGRIDSEREDETKEKASEKSMEENKKNTVNETILENEEERFNEEAEKNMQDMQATELPVHNVFSGYDWQCVWEKLAQDRERYHPFEDRAAECIQIELKNLRELPKCYWYLGNNSFLLHGFFNYHYLVVGRNEEGRWFLGVPGIYQRQERVMAVIFGFPEFLAIAQEEGEGEKSSEPVNQFGCWCRYIEE